MSTQHVPAWKRLGLKLKYANEAPEASVSAVDAPTNDNKKREHTELNGLDHHQHQSKKPRLNGKASTGDLTRSRGQNVLGESNQNDLKRKKSVTFTSDTKAEDGDSAQSIQFLVPDSSESVLEKTNTNFSDTPQKSSDTPELVSETNENKRKSKKKQKSRPAQPSSQHEAPRKARLALEYLDRFHNDRSSWKFNKNHETWIINHALSSEDIIPSSNLALASYLAGLKSTGAKQRLIEQSRQRLSEEIEGSVSKDAEARTVLIKSLKLDDNGYGQHNAPLVEAMSRPKLILWSLGENLQDLASGSRPLPRAKKNKSRTLRTEADFSSSSDSEDDTSSDSESNSESGAERVSKSALNTQPQLQAAIKPSDTSPEDTSSSGTSSDSSASSSP